MRFKTEKTTAGINILANDHYAAIPYDCSELTALAKDGVIPAGTIIPANDATAVGVLLSDVCIDENPNGTIVVHGFIKKSKMPTAPAAAVNIKQVTFVD